MILEYSYIDSCLQVFAAICVLLYKASEALMYSE